MLNANRASFNHVRILENPKLSSCAAWSSKSSHEKLLRFTEKLHDR